MLDNLEHPESSTDHRVSNHNASLPQNSALEWGLSRRSLLSAGALLGLAAIMHPTERAFAWSSWTNATSPLLKSTGMGDCVHEDLIQIAYARMLRNHANDAETESLLNPWAGTVQSDGRYATIAGDIVDAGAGKKFTGTADLAARLFRENLAYLRIGSYWNDSAANMLLDFGYSYFYAESIPKFSGSDYYSGAWDVGQHIWETNEQNKKLVVKGRRALVQFTLNDRNSFIHGMLTPTASRSAHLSHSEVKRFILQWLGVAYEYARTGKVTATNGVTQDQAEKIFKGFIDTYGQLDDNAHDMRASLKASSSEATTKLSHRKLRLRALGMMCHTLQDLWCPAHTNRTYHAGGSIPQNSILSFNIYKLQNGNKSPLFGYHIPFDRYAVSDSKNSTDWRAALTRGKGAYKGTETLANVLDGSMSCLQNADTYFNSLGMNETIACITTLFEHLYSGTAWDAGVRDWVDTEVMPTYFDKNGQSLVCDAGRRCLHVPTFVIAPIHSMKRAYSKVGLSKTYKDALAAAKSYDAWQRGSHRFFSGKYNTGMSKYIVSGHEGASIWTDDVGEGRLVDLVGKLYQGYSSLNPEKKNLFLSSVGSNGCHDMTSALGMVGGMLQEFSIDLTGSMRPDDDATMKKIDELRAFFESGLKGQGSKMSPQSSNDSWFLAADIAYADTGGENYITSNMVLEDFVGFEDGSYSIAVRDLDSLETSMMVVPASTPGKDKLEEGLANLTITYALETEFEGDLDYRYVVSNIDYSSMEKNMFLVTGTVKSASADTKKIVLDSNGIKDMTLVAQDGISALPQVGDYICARYTFNDQDTELVDYYDLEAPGEIVKATYPVEKVAGSNVWLLTNGSEADTDFGYRTYLQIDYGTADVYSVLQEGCYATVYYHDEVYGTTTDVDENALVAAAIPADSEGMSVQSVEDDLEDSPETPGYIALGDEYANSNYGNDVFHVANVIVGTNIRADIASSDRYVDPVPQPQDTSDGTSTPKANDTKPVAASSRTGKSTTSGATTPKAGDPLAGISGMLSAVAVAGTALAAYSARRVANERGDAEEG